MSNGWPSSWRSPIIGRDYTGYRFARGLRILFALRTPDQQLIRFFAAQAPIRTHAQTLASYKANGISDGTEQVYPQLPAEYHNFPYEFHPDLLTEGWIVWVVRTADVHSLQLGLATGDGGYEWWRLD